MSKDEFLYLCALFIDAYSVELSNSNDEITSFIGEKMRNVHNQMQDFIHYYDMRFQGRGKRTYYEFFFENAIENDYSVEDLINKYCKEVLADENVK